ncbi:MAG: hypothetical protein E6K16_06565 [Methanobacteriota archaeon]|nr:MAG: hypothetical protein E6K16_06565 [Euryarchaeota archaeon]
MSDERISEGDVLVLILLLSVAGVAVSGYLTWQWFQAASSTWCDVSSYFSCSRVRESPYSAVAGIPTAVAGVVGFLALTALAALLFLGRRAIGPVRVLPTLLVFATLGALIGAGLSVIEIAVIQAVCILCATGFAIDLVILALVVILWRGSSRLDGFHGDEEVLRP